MSKEIRQGYAKTIVTCLLYILGFFGGIAFMYDKQSLPGVLAVIFATLLGLVLIISLLALVIYNFGEE